MENSRMFDARSFGQAIKNARRYRGLTRNTVAEVLSITPRYLMSIENKGQMPSLQVFHDLAVLFDISVDKLFYDDVKAGKSQRRKQLDTLLTQLTEEDLLIVEGTVQGILKTHKINE